MYSCVFTHHHHLLGWMAEWSKALVLGTSLRAWVRIPLQSENIFSRGGHNRRKTLCANFLPAQPTSNSKYSMSRSPSNMEKLKVGSGICRQYITTTSKKTVKRILKERSHVEPIHLSDVVKRKPLRTHSMQDCHLFYNSINSN